MYSVEKSLTKAVKYPVFALIVGYILKLLEMSVIGLKVQFPSGVDALTQPGLAIAVGLIIFVYDWLKHGPFGVNLP